MNDPINQKKTKTNENEKKHMSNYDRHVAFRCKAPMVWTGPIENICYVSLQWACVGVNEPKEGIKWEIKKGRRGKAKDKAE